MERLRPACDLDLEEAENRLRDQVSILIDAGLDVDEAFLVAVKRIGGLDGFSPGFGLEHPKRILGDRVSGTNVDTSLGKSSRTEFLFVV